MKVLLSYLVTHEVVNRFHKTVAFQKRFFPEAIEKLDKVVVTDQQTQIKTDWPIVRADIRVNDLFNQSRAKNVAFKYATDFGYDWLFDGDADRVLINFPKVFPDPGWAQLPIYYSKQGENDEDIFNQWKSNTMKFSGSSFFVLHRNIFSRLRACEEYIVNRFDDVDFVFNVCTPNGMKYVSMDALAIHLWHSDTERAFAYEDHNRKVYMRRRMENGNFGPPA